MKDRQNSDSNTSGTGTQAVRQPATPNGDGSQQTQALPDEDQADSESGVQTHPVIINR